MSEAAILARLDAARGPMVAAAANDHRPVTSLADYDQWREEHAEVVQEYDAALRDWLRWKWDHTDV